MSDARPAAIFDFDGTIADTMLVIAASYNAHAPDYGLPHVAPADYDRIREQGAAKFMKSLGLSAFRLLRFIQLVQRDMRENMEKIKPFAGIPEVLHKLHKTYELAIVTSNQEDIVSAFLQRHDLSGVFSHIRCEKNYFGKAPIIKKTVLELASLDSAIYIGDEARDVVAATKAGVPAISVTWGFDLEPALLAAHPVAIAHTPLELQAAITHHLG